MKRRTAYRVIQVPVEDSLLRRLDAAADRVAESRAAYIREACRQRLASEEATERDRRYVEGYRRKPEDRPWGQLGAKLLAHRLRRDRW